MTYADVRDTGTGGIFYLECAICHETFLTHRSMDHHLRSAHDLRMWDYQNATILYHDEADSMRYWKKTLERPFYCVTKQEGD